MSIILNITSQKYLLNMGCFFLFLNFLKTVQSVHYFHVFCVIVLFVIEPLHFNQRYKNTAPIIQARAKQI